MSRKQLLFMGVSVVLLVNGSVFATLYLIDWMRGPSEQEIAAQKQAQLDAAKAAVYAKLPPLEAFKSKANNLRSIGEAITLCENKLHEAVKTPKSWQVNMVESRYKPSTEMYLIIMEYQTIATQDQPPAAAKVTCEVSGEKKAIELWKLG